MLYNQCSMKRKIPKMAACLSKFRTVARTNARANARANEGFTLLEIMAAVSIIAIAMVSVYRLHTQTIFMHSRARFYTTASYLAQGKIAQLRSISLDDLAAESGDFGENFDGYTWQIATQEIESEILQDSGPQLKRLTVSIVNENDSYSLTTYMLLVE